MDKVKAINRYKIYKQIMKIIKVSRYNLSARQIASILHKSGCIHSSHRQDVAPRLTELLDMGYLEKCEQVFDDETKKMVYTFDISKKGLEKLKEGESGEYVRRNKRCES